MRIDPRFFNHFMLIVAVICIAIIAITSILYIGKQEERFLNRLEDQRLRDLTFLTMEGDSLQVIRDRTTILLFWSTWSDRSLEALDDLYNWHDNNPGFEVVASYVKDSDDFAAAYDRVEQKQFIMVNGTPAYQNLRVPGIPTAIVFDSLGDIHAVEIGARDVPVWHALTSGKQRKPGAR